MTTAPVTTLADILQQAVALHQAGRLDEAAPLYGQVLAAVPKQPDASRLLGVLHLQAGRPAEAIGPLRDVLDANPAHAEVLNNLRVAYTALGRADEAVALLRALSVRHPQAAAPAMTLATILWQAGRPDEAVPAFRQVVALAPDYLDAWMGLARCLDAAGLAEEADAAYGRAIALAPSRPDLLAARGGLRQRQGQGEGAVADLAAAIALDGGVALYHFNLGCAFQGLGRLDEAVAAYGRALALEPGLGDAELNLANTLMDNHDAPGAITRYVSLLDKAPGHAEARRGLLTALLYCPGIPPDAARVLESIIAAEPDNVQVASDYGALALSKGDSQKAFKYLTAAVAADPDYEPALSLMGVLLDRLGRSDEAAPFHQRALERNDQEPGILNNMGLHQLAAGRGLEAISFYRRALALSPSAAGHSNLIFALDFDATIDVATAQAERRRWHDLYGPPGGPKGPAAAAWPNPPDPDRPLTVGYVSADFRAHSAATCFGPVVRGHDRAAFRVICYSNYTAEDAVTARFRQAVDDWRVVAGLPDSVLDGQIRADGVDILVDLSGHTLGNRLPLFAARSAPVQVSAWGHVTGTGISAMDALLADPVVIPPEERVHFAERVIDLPCFLCFEPPPDCPPVVPGPAATGAPLTFGCFNRLSKVSDSSLDLWALGLRARPRTRLLIKDPSLDGTGVRADLQARLARRGVAPERVEFMGSSSRAEHLAAYGRMDVALDPVPYSGGITSCEALWMGVPVLALPTGLTSGARSTGAILRAAGLTDFITHTPEAFAGRMVGLADDPAALVAGRMAFRDRMARTPVFDTAAYTRAVEAVYRGLWRDWCARR
ncbi:tetratricopeptide repeat protein [Azospirillum sp. B4]|uniref:tetratricopeptide repeat protein n=1 Tax=Azospirillum sp. B4 TaxID=95605 RepID=UPI000346F15D|nr:tetratricopeptide repeat protein [Azospirillum sp. B4]